MFDTIERARLEELHFRSDPASHLRAIIAIHNTRLGPALGGCRFIHYNSDDEAIHDVIRLARGMSYKAALANVPQGGGKAVILAPAQPLDPQQRVALFRAFGKFVHELGGRYITAVDSGTRLSDLDEVADLTPYVSGTARDGLDPSPMTAEGVFHGIRAAVAHRLERQSLEGIRVAIQGVGNVGYPLAVRLREAGCQLTVADTDISRVQRCVEELQAQAVAPADIFDVDCDVFAPCGLGGIIDDETIARLRCTIVAGSANNQLKDDHHGEILHRMQILYAPDYVINAGGLITVSLGHSQHSLQEINQRTRALGDTLRRLFQRSAADDRPPEQIANKMAEEILYGAHEEVSAMDSHKAPGVTNGERSVAAPMSAAVRGGTHHV
jgi:leucine dehydrogenase